MSQVSIIDIEGNFPQIPTTFVTNFGNAIPIANVLELLGEVIPAGSIPFRSVGAGNVVTYQIQISQAIIASNADNIGLAAFDSADFNVDANGFVSLSGAASGGIDTILVDDGGPVVPLAGTISLLGSIVSPTGNPIITDGNTANTAKIIVQTGSASVGSNINNAGMVSFDSSQFAVDFNGYVTLNAMALAVSSLGVQATSGGGTDPVVPTAGGLVEFEGAAVAAGTNPLRSVSTAANTLQYQVQRSQALAAADATKVGVSNFDSDAFAVDANGFVTLVGGGTAFTTFDVQANTPPGTDPVVPTVLGLVTINGDVVANHSIPLETHSRAANAFNIEVQQSSAVAASDATKSGVAHFDSANFSVDVDGFVTLDSATVAMTITGDSGGALSPTAGNWNIIGNATQGVSTSGAVSTLTITVADASTTQKGVSELATSAETITGADTGRTVTPAGLNAKLGTQTLHGVMLGGGSAGALSVTAVGATNQVLLGVTGADPIWGVVPNAALANSTITLNNGNNITITGSPISLGGAATVNVSGTTDNSLLMGNASGSISSLGVAADGEIPIGSSGADPVLNTITPGSGIAIVNGPGTITISTTGGASLLIASERAISTTAVTTSLLCAKIATTPTTANTAALLSITYTPTDANNILEFEFCCPMGPQSIAACDIGVFLFQGTSVIAGFPHSSASGQYLTAKFLFYKVAGTTSSTTWTVRWANSNAANPIYALSFSGVGTPLYNATGRTSMVFTLKEYSS